MVKKLSAKMRSAAIALGSGQEPATVAAQLGIKPQFLTDWGRRYDFQALVAEASSIYIRSAVPAAQSVLVKQLNDPNGWLAQAAAREVLHQAQLAQGAAAATVAVQFVGMPEPGMPTQDTDK